MASNTEGLQQLSALHPTIEGILAATGSAGASIGVCRAGEIWTDHFGYRDHGRKRVPDDATLYTIGSLTKGMVAQALGSLVEGGDVTWDTKIKSLVPDFNSADPVITEHCTIADALSHRTGLPTFNVLWYQGGSYSLVKKEDLIPMINAMKPTFPFRAGWGYTNWTYALIGVAIENLTGKPWPDLLRARLWDPLGMSRTTAGSEARGDANVAEGFSALPDLTPFPVRSQECDYDSIMGSAGGVSSTITELLEYYSALTRACIDQAKLGSSSTAGSPFKLTTTILSGHTVLFPPVFGMYSENTYGFGWIKTTLPARLGLLSDNPGVVPSMPVVAENTKSQTIYYHQGCLSGITSCVFIMPESDTCIVTLVNTRSLGDSSDWIAQLLLETLVDAPHGHDFIKLAEEGAKGQSTRYCTAERELNSDRVPDTVPGALGEYTGRYYWDSDRYFIDVIEHQGLLKLVVQGRKDQTYNLTHHHYDTFTWLMTDEEEQKRGRFIQSTNAYKISFEREGDHVTSFVWNEMGGGKGHFKKSKNSDVASGQNASMSAGA